MSNVQEIWNPIPGFIGYEASSFGRVRSLTRMINGREYIGKVLKAHANSHGYLHVAVGSPAKVQTVHKLVTLAFYGERQNGQQVNHKNGIKTDCRPENLEYTTSTENNRHAILTGLKKCKISADQIQQIKLMSDSLSLRKIGKLFGIHHKYVRKILDGKIVIGGGQ